MAHTPFSQNRGIYSLVTAFMFIMMILFVVLGMRYLASILTSSKAQVNDEMTKYNYIMDAKGRLLSSECYGQVFGQDELNETCEFPPGIIKGYSIEMLRYKNCSNETVRYEHIWSREPGEIYTYFVPIQSNTTGLLCPGRLKVIY